MTTLEKAARLALDALKNAQKVRAGEGGTKHQTPLENAAITVLEDALAQQAAPQQAEPVELTDAAIEAAITAWFEWHMSDDSDHAPFRDRMRAAIKAAQDFKEVT
jgi:hypothetical protein